MSGKTVSDESVSSKSVSDKSVSSESVSNKSVSSVDNGSSVGNSDGVGHCVVGNGLGNSVNKRGSMGNGVVGNRDSLRVGSSSGVGDLGDVTIDVVGVVVDGLDTAVRKVHLVGALNNTGAIVALGLAESSARVFVSHSVVVGVGGDLSKVRGSIADSMVGNGGSVDNGGVVDNGGMVDNRGMVDNGGGMDKGCSMGHSMAKTVSNNAMGETVSDNTMGKSVANDSMSEAVSGNNSVSKTVSGQELGSGRGSSQQGGDASKGLRKSSCEKFSFQCF